MIQALIHSKAIKIGLVALVAIAAWLYLANHTFVRINIHVEHSTAIQFFWAKEAGAYTENKSVKVDVYSGKRKYWMMLPSIKGYQYLRIDPTRRQGSRVNFEGVRVYQNGDIALNVQSSKDWQNKVISVSGLEVNKIRLNQMELTATHYDPQIEFKLNWPKK